jgi:hypothetical protein
MVRSAEIEGYICGGGYSRARVLIASLFLEQWILNVDIRNVCHDGAQVVDRGACGSLKVTAQRPSLELVHHRKRVDGAAADEIH